MNYPLAFAFLFAVGAMGGWCIEFLYRNLISGNGPRGKYFINPGFCRGPWLPIYGIGVTCMFTISALVTSNMTEITPAGKLLVIIVIALIMTAIEFIGGYFLLKFMNLRLWDYRKEPGNIMGIVCPKFTIIWGTLGAIYFLFVHKIAIKGLVWLSQNLAFSFFIGAFSSAFLIDLITSAKDAWAIKQFGDDNTIIVKYEELKEAVQKKLIDDEGRSKFFVQNRKDGQTLTDALKENVDAFEDKKDAFKRKLKKDVETIKEKIEEKNR